MINGAGCVGAETLRERTRPCRGVEAPSPPARHPVPLLPFSHLSTVTLVSVWNAGLLPWQRRALHPHTVTGQPARLVLILLG